MRRILFLLLFSIFCISSTCFSAPEPTKKVVIIYKVEDTALECQNAENDIIAGKQELEKELVNHYKKRFIVEGIKRGPTTEEKQPASFYQELAGEGKTPLIITIYLKGQGEAYTQYQNAYGAKATGVAPAINVGLLEIILEPTGDDYSFWDYGVSSYSAGTVSAGRFIFAVQEDPRKNAKNAIRGVFRDACKFDETINRYANPTAYSIETDRYSGNFQAAREKYNKIYGAINARIAKFMQWCKSDSTRADYLLPLNIFTTPEQKLNYIDGFIKMGVYKE